MLLASSIAPVTVFRSMPSLLNGAERGLGRGFPLEPTLRAHREYEAGLDAAIDRAAAQAANIRVFDPATITCAESCRAVMQNTLLYSDSNHVSMPGSLLFKGVLVREHF